MLPDAKGRGQEDMCGGNGPTRDGVVQPYCHPHSEERRTRGETRCRAEYALLERPSSEHCCRRWAQDQDCRAQQQRTEPFTPTASAPATISVAVYEGVQERDVREVGGRKRRPEDPVKGGAPGGGRSLLIPGPTIVSLSTPAVAWNGL